MAEFEEKLNAILGDPAAMRQIASIAKALTGADVDANASPPPPDAPETADDAADADDAFAPVFAPTAPTAPAAPEAPPEAPQNPPDAAPDWSALLGLVGGLSGGEGGIGLDPKLMQLALQLFGAYSATDDRKVALLTALKPFVSETRYAKVDKAVQIAKLAHVIRVAFRLFQKEGDDV